MVEDTRSRTAVIVATLVLLAMLSGGLAGIAAADVHEACAFPLELTDATGEVVALDDEPETVVTLAPSAAQTLWEIGAQDKVVGVSMYGLYLDWATEPTDISADPASVDIEAVVDLEPDLVLAPNVTPQDEIAELRELGLTVYHPTAATDLDDVMEKTLVFGALVGECDGAQATVADMEDRLDRIDEQVAEVDDRPLAFFEMGDGFTAGSGTFQGIALERAGVTNLASAVGIVMWEPISPELLIDEDPAWIVHPDVITEDDFLGAVEETTAWEEGQVAVVDTQHVSQPAPRIVDAIEEIHVQIHGELDEPTPTPTPGVAQPIPGFGVALALLGLSGVGVLLLRRR